VNVHVAITNRPRDNHLGLRYALDGHRFKPASLRFTVHGLGPGRHRLVVALASNRSAMVSTTFVVRRPPPAKPVPVPAQTPATTTQTPAVTPVVPATTTTTATPPPPRPPSTTTTASPSTSHGTGIPQGNGGDGDADNNGGPSDGDGNI
jgi:hypothetical protein